MSFCNRYTVAGLKDSHLVDVRDELSFMRHIWLLVVGSELALDGEEEHLQVALLLKPAQEKIEIEKYDLGVKK